MVAIHKPTGHNATCTAPKVDSPQRIGMDLVYPYGVYVDYCKVAEYATDAEANQHFQSLYQAHMAGVAA